MISTRERPPQHARARLVAAHEERGAGRVAREDLLREAPAEVVEGQRHLLARIHSMP